MLPLTRSNRARRPRPGNRSGAAALRLLIVAVGLTSSVLVLAQRAPDRDRTMFVTVVDGSGAPVKGLRPDDFVVREDGVQREILRVEPATGPIEITLLVDNSQAATPFIGDFRGALADFMRSVGKGNEIGLTSFGG